MAKLAIDSASLALKIYSVGPSQNYTRYLPVNFRAAVTNIFQMRLTSCKIQDGRQINKNNR